MQELWAAAADMLAFLKDAAMVIDEILAPIVKEMMNEIYRCGLFIREYGGDGFLSQYSNVIHLLRDNLK